MTHYFACSICSPGEDYCQENFNRITQSNGFVLHRDTPQKGTYSEINVGDILILKYNYQFIAYGKVNNLRITDAVAWNHWAYVDEWVYFNSNNRERGVTTYGIGDATEGGGQYGTVKTLDSNFGFNTIGRINRNTNLYQELLIEIQNNIQMEKIESARKILEFKHQIILQGPPGTGKTKLAKEIAQEMTKAFEIDHRSKINDFLTNFRLNQDIENHRMKINNLLREFQQEFKKDNIENISLENYALGLNRQSFCWWLEYGLVDIARYNGQAAKFKLYWNKSEESFKKAGFIKDMEDDVAIAAIGEILGNIVREENLNEAANKLSKSLVLKILISYFPEKYFPIVNEECIDNACILLDVPLESNNIFEKNIAIQQKFQELAEGKDIKNYEFMYFLFGNFQMRGKLIIENRQVQAKGEYQIIQFHPAYSYEDFVRGITVKSEGNNIYYQVEDKTLVEFAQKALDNPSANFVLIIDEINRANLPSVLGELIYALEYRFDPNNEGETSVSSMYQKEDQETNLIKLPKNLFIIGTMNTSDRSVGHLDYAIRRRFAFVDVLPEVLIIGNFQKESFEKVSGLFISNFAEYESNPKAKLKKSDCLNDEFRPEDVWLGHSYFISKNEEFNIRREYEIVPILKEYVKDGILRDTPETWKIIEEIAL